MKAAVAVTMMLCLVITFQSSYSITCYQCLSGNYSDPECEQISSDFYSKPCEARHNQCATFRWRRRNDESAFVRACGSSDYLQEYANTLEATYKSGVRFGIFSCNTDGCNASE